MSKNSKRISLTARNQLAMLALDPAPVTLPTSQIYNGLPVIWSDGALYVGGQPIRWRASL